MSRPQLVTVETARTERDQAAKDVEDYLGSIIERKQQVIEASKVKIQELNRTVLRQGRELQQINTSTAAPSSYDMTAIKRRFAAYLAPDVIDDLEPADQNDLNLFIRGQV